MKIKEIQNKIQEVFDRLAVKGIIGKQKYWCCQTCGSSAITDYSDEFKGYVFYHEQDFDNLKEDKVCYLSFNSFEDDGQKNVEVGNEIVKEFEKAGIKVNWDGKIETRIQIDFN